MRHVLLFAVLTTVLTTVVACDTAAVPATPVVVGTDVGEQAPVLQGRSAAGAAFTLEADAPTVVIFYNSAECGLCRVQLDRLQEHLPAYDRLGAKVVAVTLDAPEATVAVLDTARIHFPLVSVDTATFREWGAMRTDRPTPLPAAYVLDSSRIVRFLDIGRNASDRATDAELVTILEGLSRE